MLTEREMEILLLIAKGYSNQEIASASHITIKTVKTHVSNIFKQIRSTRPYTSSNLCISA